MLRQLSVEESAEYRITVGGDERSYYSRAVKMTCLAKPYLVHVKFKDGPSAPASEVGRYAFDLEKMLAAGLVRKERLKGEWVARLIIRRHGGAFFIQLNEGAPRLKLPRA